jgi:hypothetical protein
MILAFECGVNEVCAFLEFYAASIDSFLPTFQYKFGGGEILAVMLVKICHLGHFALSAGQFTLVFRASSPR